MNTVHSGPTSADTPPAWLSGFLRRRLGTPIGVQPSISVGIGDSLPAAVIDGSANWREAERGRRETPCTLAAHEATALQKDTAP